MNYYVIEGSRKNSKLYVHNSFLYLFHRDCEAHFTVRCREWKKSNCKARGKIMKLNDFFEDIGNHTHPSNEEEIDLLKMKTKLKRKSEISSDTLRGIFDDVSEITPGNIATKITFNQVESGMFKRRKKIEPPLPDSAVNSALLLNEGEICASFRRSIISDNGCALIFTTDEQEVMLHDCNFQLGAVDATFKFCPRFFYQVLCVHIVCNNDGRSHAFPIVICAMTKKTEIFYVEVFRVIKDLFPAFVPNVIMADFEAALRNAVALTYTNADLKGCWFHYKQAVLRKIQQHFVMADRSRDEIKDWFHSILSVPLLPANKIGEAFDILLNKEFDGVDTDRFKRYVRRAWYNGIDFEQLSVYRMKDRTNNAAEAFNRQFNKFANNSRRPNFFHFLRRVSQVLHTSHLEYIRLHNGLQITRGVTRKESKFEQRMVKVWDLYDIHGSIRTFFHHVKHFTDADMERFVNDDSDDSDDDTENDDDDENGIEHVDAQENASVHCRVCLATIREEESRWCLIPCGHAPFCGPCCEIIVGPRITRTRRQTCPVCRQDIERSCRLFF